MESERKKGESGGELRMDRESIRTLGYKIIDMLVDHHEALHDKPVTAGDVREKMEQIIRGGFSEEGEDVDDVLRFVQQNVFANITHVTHPRFFAYIPGPGNFVSAVTEALAAGFNPFMGSWHVSAGASQLEVQTLEWLRELCELPETAGGLFVSGGSVANLTALGVARHVKLADAIGSGIIYCSDQTHSSVDRAARMTGFPQESIRKIPVDVEMRMRCDALEAAIVEDRAAGNQPFCLIANAGTTSTGAVDPLDELADVCEREGLWFHVDGAYGAAAMLTEEGKFRLRGIGRADSLTLDPHKWLFQPFECGCLLVRNKRLLRDTYRIVPAYLKDSDLAEENINFRDYGLQLTRNFRALKLWMSLKIYGMGEFRRAVTHGIRLAEVAERRLRESGMWEVVTKASLGIVSFRYHHDGMTAEEVDGMNRAVTSRMYSDAFAALSTTVLNDHVALRLCTINPRTTEKDVTDTIVRMEHFVRMILAERA